ncbi:MAG: hypothetical protein ABFS56_22920 [Pseudomonadota bacterium]
MNNKRNPIFSKNLISRAVVNDVYWKCLVSVIAVIPIQGIGGFGIVVGGNGGIKGIGVWVVCLFEPDCMYADYFLRR